MVLRKNLRGKECLEMRTFHSGGLHSFYSSTNIIWVLKSQKMEWTGNVACMGEIRNAYKMLATDS
jgi:hypothetical protein